MPGYKTVPEAIRMEVQNCSSETFVVVCTRAVDQAQIESDQFAHLTVRIEDSEPAVAASVLPAADRGRWSKYNLYGRVITRRDLPKVRKYMGGWYAPNFGDPSKGEHYVSIERDVFQKQTLHGLQLPLSMTVRRTNSGRVQITAQVDRVFTRSDVESPDFLMALSLLRENLGQPHIVSSDLSVDDWLSDQQVAWELLPVGTGPAKITLQTVVSRMGAALTPDRLAVFTERFEAMEETGYSAVIVGHEGFRRYVGYQFKDDLVLLENFDYGNALYVLYSNWQVNSSKPRLALIADADAEFDRVPHTKGWRARVSHLLKLHGHAVP